MLMMHKKTTLDLRSLFFSWCPQRESNLQFSLTMAALYHLTIGAWVLSCNIDFILKAAYCQLQFPKNVHNQV